MCCVGVGVAALGQLCMYVEQYPPFSVGEL